MILTIRKKLSLGVGTLMGLLLVSGLVSYLQIHVVEERLVEVLEVDEPISATAYEMEINLIGTGFGLLGYLHDRDPLHLERIRDDAEDFARHLREHRTLLEQDKAEYMVRDYDIRSAMVDELEQRYGRFESLAKGLIAVEDEQTAKMASLLKALRQIDTLLDDKIQPAITPDAPQAYEKLSAVLDMEINANGIAKGLGSFLRTHQPEYEDRVHDDERDFAEHLAAYRNLRLSAQEKGWAEEAEDLFDKIVELAKDIIALDKEKEKTLAEFVQIRRELDALLDDRIQVATHTDLNDAKTAAHAAVERSSLLTVVLLAGILVGGLTGVMVVRSIVRPVDKLVAVTRAMTSGDLTQRVEIKSSDELGKLGAAFNEMLDVRQTADAAMRASEQTLREAKEYTDDIIRSMIDMLLVIAPDGDIVTVNEATTRLLGYREEELIGQPASILFSEQEEDITDGILSEETMPLKRGVLRRLAMEGPIGNIEKSLRTKSGDEIPVLMSGSVMRDNDGQIRGLVCVAQDITLHKKTEEQLRRREVELAHASRLSTMGATAMGLAHELNQPLSAVTTYAGACKKMLGTDDDNELMVTLDKVISQADRAGKIIHRLRSFIRNEEPKRTMLDINGLIHETIDMVATELRLCNIATILELDHEIPPVFADAIQIQQVIVNLVRNAIDSMMQIDVTDHRLTIQSRIAGDNAVTIVVRDTGAGFEDGVAKHLFDPFFTTKTNGMGIGLSVSRSIAETHGGKIWAKPNSNRGVTFHFELSTGSRAFDDNN